MAGLGLRFGLFTIFSKKCRAVLLCTSGRWKFSLSVAGLCHQANDGFHSWIKIAKCFNSLAASTEIAT
jgi:hypothetical protein